METLHFVLVGQFYSLQSTLTWKLEYSANILENLIEILSSVQSSLNNLSQ